MERHVPGFACGRDQPVTEMVRPEEIIGIDAETAQRLPGIAVQHPFCAQFRITFGAGVAKDKLRRAAV